MSKLFFILALWTLSSFCPIWSQPERKSNWPEPHEWENLNKRVEGRLLHLKSPLQQCSDDPSGSVCKTLLKELNNPFIIEELPWATQSTGWLKGWSTAVSPYAVAACTTEDIVAAVEFAKKHKVKLVIKGSGHDYLGRSNAPNSLLIWTHHMRDITLHDTFIPQEAPKDTKGVPAATVQAGTRWIEAYHEVMAKQQRLIEGGGCTTVGVAGGFLQGGGFGSFSKKYGLAAGSLLEAEVVIASGEVLIANAYQNSDLFWALKGGGGGTFGVVSKVTLLTHDLPDCVGILQGKISANSDGAYKELIQRFIHFYREALNNEHWGEQVKLSPDNSLTLFLLFQGLTKREAEKIWVPFLSWANDQPQLFSVQTNFIAFAADLFWDYHYWITNHPNFVTLYKKEPSGDLFYWTPNQNEVSAFWYAMESRWLPIALFEKEAAQGFTETLFHASRHWPLALHFNKGLAGASPEARQRDRETAINPIALDSAALVILTGATRGVFPGIRDHEPNLEKGETVAKKIEAAMKILTDATPNSGAYSNEASYFQKDWQEAFWGSHYPRLLEIKRKYDPDGLFQCHHCVGS